MLTLSVGKSGEEDFFTILEALDSIPYEEKAVITAVSYTHLRAHETA